MLSTTARERRFNFEGNKAVMARFIQLYKDMFVPYADNTCKYRRAMDKIYGYREEYGSYEEGFCFSGVTHDVLYAKMEPKELKGILATGLFKKVKISHNRYEYVYVG